VTRKEMEMNKKEIEPNSAEAAELKTFYYPATVRRVEDPLGPYYEAVLTDFGRAISGVGQTPMEAIHAAYVYGAESLEDIEKHGGEIPEPSQEQPWEHFSGKFTVRVPRSVHYRLFQASLRENVSLNSLVNKMLIDGLSGREVGASPINFVQASVTLNHYSGRPTFADQISRSTTATNTVAFAS
jgi:predicted HicB family RNase H-like nuclease